MRTQKPIDGDAEGADTGEGARPRRRPGGRSDRVRGRVARACLDLLSEGHIELTAADVAARSGVSRSTIYRWWPTPTDLMREAMELHTRRLRAPADTGTWFGDLHALVAMLAEFFCDPIERAQNAVLASGQYPELNAFVFDYYVPIVAQWQETIRRAIERGEVTADTDPDAVVRQVVSPLLVITVLERRNPTTDELSQIARLVLRATSATAR